MVRQEKQEVLNDDDSRREYLFILLILLRNCDELRMGAESLPGDSQGRPVRRLGKDAEG